MQTQTKLAVVLLTKNEEVTIETTLSKIKSFVENKISPNASFYLIDDSNDRTPEIARQQGFTVVSAGQKGLGWAYYSGIQSISNVDNYDLILTMDGDGQAVVDEIPAFLNAINEAGADMIVGSRFLNQDLVEYRYPKINRVGVRLLSKYISLMTDQKFTDSHGGIRIMKGSVAKGLKIFGKHTYVQESIVDAVERGYKVIEIPSRWTVRLNGRSKVVDDIPKYIINTAPYLFYRFLRRLLPNKSV